jgi:zinc D-Ala-D-Ala carboxypeptidase
MTMVTKNFSAKELACPCCGVMGVKKTSADRLQKLREKFGKSISLTSAYRCAKHNKAVGGAPQSFHMQGMAFDIPCTNPRERHDIVILAAECGFRGFEISPKHVHIDDGPRDEPVILWTDFKTIC